MHRIYAILVLLILVSGLHAQNDLSSLLFFKNHPALQANPALHPEGIVVNVAGVYNNTWITNITFNDLIREDGNQTVFDIDNVINQLGDDNIIRDNFDLETIGLSMRIGNLGINVGHRLRVDGLIDYPKELPQLIWEGNAQFIGQTVDFGPAFELTAFNEWSVGASYGIKDNIRIGGRVKFLSGVNNLSTAARQMSLTTDEEAYQLTLDADYVVNSAGILNYNDLRDVSVDFNSISDFTGQLFGSNTGMAFDFGAAIKIEKLHLAVSAIDLGGEISWEDNVKNYTVSGTQEFAGLDFAQELFDEGEDLGAFLDTLLNTFEPTQSSTAYTTQLGAKFYLNAQYELSDEILVGLIGYTDNYRDLNNTAFALTGSIDFSPVLRVGGFVGLRNERFDNLGANATLRLGPVHLLAATDNLITAFRPKDASVANFRLGLNLVFGQQQAELDRSVGNRVF